MNDFFLGIMRPSLDPQHLKRFKALLAKAAINDGDCQVRTHVFERRQDRQQSSVECMCGIMHQIKSGMIRPDKEPPPAPSLLCFLSQVDLDSSPPSEALPLNPENLFLEPFRATSGEVGPPLEESMNILAEVKTRA